MDPFTGLNNCASTVRFPLSMRPVSTAACRRLTKASSAISKVPSQSSTSVEAHTAAPWVLELNTSGRAVGVSAPAAPAARLTLLRPVRLSKSMVVPGCRNSVTSAKPVPMPRLSGVARRLAALGTGW